MHARAKIQKWGNSSAVRLPMKALAAAGLSADSEVEIQASKGCIVIKLKQPSKERQLDKILAESPDMAELIAEVRKGLNHAIAMTEQATQVVDETRADLTAHNF